MKQQVINSIGVAALMAVLAVPVAEAETLDEAWAVALREDLAVQAAESRVSAASMELAAARASRLPTLSVSAGVQRFGEAPEFDFSAAGLPGTLPLFDADRFAMADARVSLPLYAGGMIRHGIDAAESAMSSRAAQSSAVVQDIKLGVARHYIGVLHARRAVDVALSSVRSLAAHVDDVERMYEAGAVARNDLLSAAVSLADAQQRRLQASNAFDLASAAYNRALGRALGAPVDLEETLPGIDPQLESNSLETLTEMAVASRHELHGLEAAADALRSQARATRGRSLPQLAVTGGYVDVPNEFLNQDNFWMVGVGVRWSLFDGGQARRQADAQAWQAKALSHEQADFESMVRLQVRQAWLRLEETGQRVLVTERAVDYAEENLRVVRERYRNGEGTNTEVLDAEMLRSLSHSNYHNAYFDARLAMYELARGVGRL